jgi:hypothetical protein
MDDGNSNGNFPVGEGLLNRTSQTGLSLASSSAMSAVVAPAISGMTAGLSVHLEG